MFLPITETLLVLFPVGAFGVESVAWQVAIASSMSHMHRIECQSQGGSGPLSCLCP